jgi:hypothetical protein
MRPACTISRRTLLPENDVTDATPIEQVAQVVDRAVTDPAFRQRLTSAPAGTLQGEGIDVPAGTDVRILENTETLRHFILRPRPAGLSDADLAAMPAGGGETDPLAVHAQLVADTWRDAGLRARLIADPASVMAERGISLPAGMSIRVVDASDGALYLAIPPASAS